MRISCLNIPTQELLPDGDPERLESILVEGQSLSYQMLEHPEGCLRSDLLASFGAVRATTN